MNSQVMFRTGVTTKSPEGAKWTLITVPLGCEVNQLDVGSTGLVWAALLDGRALVRIGVTRESLNGDSWVEVRSPGENLRINQLSVGNKHILPCNLLSDNEFIIQVPMQFGLLHMTNRFGSEKA